MPNDTKPKVLIVVTSHDRLGDTGEKTGFWLEELAAPYYVFRDAGLAVDIASPKGGAAPHDPRSLDRAGSRPATVERFLSDDEARRKIEATLPLDEVDASAYAAVFLAGGHGTMWDLPGSAALARILGEMHDRGAAVAAVCHGPAGLVGARGKDGRPIVAGKRVTAFTNAEEEGAKLTGVVPFLLESKLRELGGTFVAGEMWKAHAVRDGNLVTGQNPASSERAARLVLEALSS
jgi:putative intracellular protease/amidase